MSQRYSILQGETGRRERKKRQTRDALIDAAFRLFERKGFEATSVEEIAEQVDLSSRTFFRYFASKEDAALAVQEEQLDTLEAELRARPAGEPLMTALREAAVSVTRAGERGQLTFDGDLFQIGIFMTRRSPAVQARSLVHAHWKTTCLARAIADRMGVDPARDLRPHLLAVMTCGALRSAADLMADDPTLYPSLSAAVNAAFSMLETGIARSA